MVLSFQHVYPMQIFSMGSLIQQICIARLPGLGPTSGSNDIKMIKTNNAGLRQGEGLPKEVQRQCLYTKIFKAMVKEQYVCR